MAIAHDAATRFPTTDGTADSTSGDRSFTHTPSGTPSGVVVLVGGGGSSSAVVTGVTYGGSAMTQVCSASDTDEAGWTAIYFLGSAVPSGAQTVVLQGSSAFHWAWCCTLTSATGSCAVDTFATVNTTTSTNYVTSLTTAASTMSYAIVHSGINAPGSASAATGCTNLGGAGVFGADYGTSSSMAVKRTSVDAAGTFTIGSTGSSEDFCVSAAAIKEGAAVGGSTFVPQITIVL